MKEAKKSNIRKNISKKTRFEVFKRDSFQCQYCGSKAPDIVLEVDHINPVAKGGKNDIMNLITSCFGCNRGKSDREISDDSVIQKQLKQIEDLNEKRNQMEMLLAWRNEMDNLDDIQLGILEDKINERLTVTSITQTFKNDIKRDLKKYGFKIMLDAIDLSSNQYLRDVENPLNRSNFLTKITGIAKNISLPPIDQKINYTSGYISKGYGVEYWKVKQEITDYCQALKGFWDYSDQNIINDLDTAVKDLHNKSRSWYIFRDALDNWITEIKTRS